jgi:hypothetical protein
VRVTHVLRDEQLVVLKCVKHMKAVVNFGAALTKQVK